jgi:hypothetical protein
MNSPDEIGIARESLQRSSFIDPEKLGHIVLLYIQMREVKPGQRIFRVAPDLFNRVQLVGLCGGNSGEIVGTLL